MAKKIKRFPVTLYCAIEDLLDGEEYIGAFEAVPETEDGQAVAEYRLVSVKTMRVTRELIGTHKGKG